MDDTITAIEDWGRERGILNGTGTPEAQVKKLGEETAELALAVGAGDKPGIMDGIGDSVVVLTLLARLCGTTIDECVEHAYNEIRNRKGKTVNGQFVKDENTPATGKEKPRGEWDFWIRSVREPELASPENPGGFPSLLPGEYRGPGFYFWSQGMEKAEGPYDTREAARKALKTYRGEVTS